MDAAKAYEILNTQLTEGERIASSGAEEAAYSQWLSETRHWVAESFGENSPKADEFEMAGAVMGVITSGMGPAHFAQMRRDELASKLRHLRAFVSVLKKTAEQQAPSNAQPTASTSPTSFNKVFVVHGRDEARETVARYLEKLGLEAVILHEQPSGGRTIIEKFESYADVAFAVVLMTPDDRGGPAAATYEEQMPRARQNVILELGYFLGRLGRARVCALYKHGTEIPSDFQGVVFVPFDDHGAWRLLLGRELQEVIPSVDLNKAT